MKFQSSPPQRCPKHQVWQSQGWWNKSSQSKFLQGTGLAQCNLGSILDSTPYMQVELFGSLLCSEELSPIFGFFPVTKSQNLMRPAMICSSQNSRRLKNVYLGILEKNWTNNDNNNKNNNFIQVSSALINEEITEHKSNWITKNQNVAFWPKGKIRLAGEKPVGGE